MTSSLLFTTILTTVSSFYSCFATPSDLDAVVVVFRHGDRTPVGPYPTDPYKDRSNWPADWGMLTNIGKRQHFELGQYFRQRYADFLPQEYSHRDIYVRSTDVDRTLMSAEANLAGLFPPVKNDVWDNGLSWQPIPIHTSPEKQDPILAAKKPCRKHEILLKNLFKSDFFMNISHANHDLYAYLTRYSGESIYNLENMEYLYNTFKIETLYNLTLPVWAQKVFPRKMKHWAELSFATATYTTDLARLKTGPFFNELITYFRNRTATPAGARFYAPKFLMFSAHDSTIANLLNSMEAFEHHCPPYTATIIFELHKTPQNQSYLNVFYKNTSEARPIKVRNCEFNCDIKHFEDYMSPIVLTVDQWESECNSMYFFESSMNIYIIGSAVLLGISAIVFLLILVRSRAMSSEASLYSQLPNEEYA